MNNKALLEAAARAIGKRVVCTEAELHGCDERGMGVMLEGVQEPWNPRADDGDAFRLAVKRGICFGPNLDGDCAVAFGSEGVNYVEPHGSDPCGAARLVILRAAAAALAKEPA